MLGYSGYRELGELAKNNRHRLSQQFNIIPERVPSSSTIRRVMMGVEWQSLLKMFNEWALEEYGQRDDINGSKSVLSEHKYYSIVKTVI
jgi:hypothetical protein